MRVPRIAAVVSLVSALGCGDGIGRPIVGEAPAASAAGAPGGFGGAGTGGRGALPDFGGRFSGWGGWDGRREPPPDAPCEGIDPWPEESSAAEFAMLELLRIGRDFRFSCTDGSVPVAAPPLVMKPELQCAARRHSLDMAMRGFFDHTNPDGQTPEDRIRRTGYVFGVVGESIARASGAPEEVLYDVAAAGSSECQNLVDSRFDSVGIGRSGDLWTLDFAGP